MKETQEKYIEAVGRRKTSVARVRLYKATKTSYEVNGKSVEDYFLVKEAVLTVLSPMALAKASDKYRVSIKVNGGGIMSQAGAVRHGIARALNIADLNLRIVLKKAGFLKRDSRAKERRKFGLVKARKAPQWSKR